MLKQISLSLAALALLASCSVKEERLDCSAPVTVSVSGFNVSQEPFTKAVQSVEDATAIKAITLAFYSGNTEVYKAVQLRDDATTYTTFGNFSLRLPHGNYTMVVIAEGSATAVELSSPTEAELTDERIRDVFTTTQSVSVSGIDPIDISATLQRIVALVGVTSTDPRPAEAVKLRMTFSEGSMRFNPTSGLAIDLEEDYQNTIVIAEAIGAVAKPASLLLLRADEVTLDITLETLDANDNVLYTTTLTNVPVKRGTVTALRGNLFSLTGSGSFQLDTAWPEAPYASRNF